LSAIRIRHQLRDALRAESRTGLLVL
jgi:hypothetical protein